jgi:DNA-binding PadR family transcriptional regulator
VGKEKSDILNGTLALMALRTIEALGPIHGYGIARRIEQGSKGVLELNQGTLYPMLLQLQQAGWVSSKWAFRIRAGERSSTRSRERAGSDWRSRRRTGGGSPLSSNDSPHRAG